MARIDDIKPGAIFTHYKNKDYEIITLAKDEANSEDVVVYRMLYGDRGVWTRRLDNFCKILDVDGIQKERFALKKPA